MRNKLYLFLCLFITSCTAVLVPPSATDPTSLASLQQMSNKKQHQQNKKVMGKIREMALKEAALSVGAQSGLASRAKYIDDSLVRMARNLDIIYDFNALILEHNVMPPVLLEGRNTLNIADPQTIRLSNRMYKVSKQAHFITTPPGWRQYLWMDYKPPELPHTSLLPITKDEQIIWSVYVEKGWNNGIEQANTILEENIARINEDFNGMILYRKLLAMNMVSVPYVSHTDLGITGDGAEIHIDDRVLRITALPALNTNSNEWRAAVEKDSVAVEKFNRMEKRLKSTTINISNKSWQPIIASP